MPSVIEQNAQQMRSGGERAAQFLMELKEKKIKNKLWLVNNQLYWIIQTIWAKNTASFDDDGAPQWLSTLPGRAGSNVIDCVRWLSVSNISYEPLNINFLKAGTGLHLQLIGNILKNGLVQLCNTEMDLI